MASAGRRPGNRRDTKGQRFRAHISTRLLYGALVGGVCGGSFLSPAVFK